MRESLRLGPPATIRTTSPYEDTVIGGGKYALEKNVRVMCNVYMVHRDPKVWGEDVRVVRVVLSRSLTQVCRLRSSGLSGCWTGNSRLCL